MLLLQKKATGNNKSLTTQILLATSDDKCFETEKIWTRSGYFGDQKGNFTISNVKFPDSVLPYVKQGSISTIKGDFAICLDYVILRQLIPAQNNPENIEKYK